MDYKVKPTCGLKSLQPTQTFINVIYLETLIIGNALPPMKNLPAKNRELGNLIRAAIRMMLLDGHTELGFYHIIILIFNTPKHFSSISYRLQLIVTVFKGRTVCNF